MNLAILVYNHPFFGRALMQCARMRVDRTRPRGVKSTSSGPVWHPSRQRRGDDGEHAALELERLSGRTLSAMQRPLVSRLGSIFKSSTSHSRVFNVSYQACFALQSHPAGFFKTSVTPVDLRYDVFQPKDASKTERPLVILHGLLYVLGHNICVLTCTDRRRQWNETELAVAVQSHAS